MSRPKPKIMLEWTNSKNYNTEQILQAKFVYAVFHEGKPFNLKCINKLKDTPPPKYKKTSFSNSGHAFNLADRLNLLFKTDKFTVHKMIPGSQLKQVPAKAKYQEDASDEFSED